ncbi:hypothetical protein LAZ67_8000842 [Cordylochernes scorpioides]|uniref:ATP-dependent DNA helicase n=1 Tax=Cordylochernes scorpioides TaxID=51811 RepID=A0ABY6KSK9_9ARAC|nr:hypothetical protein LAZ67_8000842 [Cordylochernes scorpioides]
MLANAYEIGLPIGRLHVKLHTLEKQNLYHGKRTVKQCMCSHVLEVQILTGTNVGHIVLVSNTFGSFRYQHPLHSEEARVSTRAKPLIEWVSCYKSLCYAWTALCGFFTCVNFGWHTSKVEAQILTETNVGHTVLFSLRLAFARTINKAQVQIFGFLLQEPVFAHGQLYVAFSRVQTLDSILPFSLKNALHRLYSSINTDRDKCWTHCIGVKTSLASSDIYIPFILKRQEFTLGFAFPMTINKAQGQTFDRVGLLLQEPVFMHGQFYVAFSCVRTFDSIHVKLNPSIYKTIKSVFNEVL